MINIKIVSKTQKLYDKYEIFLNNMIGKGSYSNVYMGRIIDEKIINENMLSSDIIAVKKIKMDNLDQKSFKMISDEVNIMQKIMKLNTTCNNIIKCIDIIEEFDFIYIIMEYCENGDLSKLIGKPIKENIVKYYFSQIINALCFLNENNIIHRDIKPKNILLKKDKRELVLCDFGFARIKTMQRVKTICGSPLYMAPELLEEKSYTDIVDIWAIGMILYEMIYGKHPYEECKDIDDLKEFSKKSITIPPTCNTNINVTEDCIDLMKKMLEKEEKNRITLDNLFKHPWIKDLISKNIKTTVHVTIMEESEEDSDTHDSNSDTNSQYLKNNNINRSDSSDSGVLFNFS